ncbi:MAG: Unknown protein [uncultured Sulfurovum sp.]|uniref:Uncharacterized protein n=1 Tax=uncultured Sulfurovum sp. TaxID=269237 RepID=A0A6S6TYB2_9BACT|nr:MAG: Unknown protein [uncultured Sulfurovum sp.]
MTQIVFYIDIKPTHLSQNSYYDHKGVLMKAVTAPEIKQNSNWIDDTFASMSEEESKDLLEIIKNRKELFGGSLSKYANKSLIKNEDRGWKQHIEEKHKV